MATRRDEPTRIEGFSDAVFGFSLTLLAFSLEVPSSISALLFLVVFYAYPLKFMAVYLWMLVAGGLGWTGITSAIVNSGSLDAGVRAGRGDDFALLLIYNLGFIALFTIFALPHHLAGMSGMVYMFMGPVHGLHGVRTGRARALLLATRIEPAEPRDGS